MNKILNWTFGACFRTLGKFLAIICIFALFILIGSKLDIELPDWLALRVSAASNYGFATGWSANLPNIGRVDYKECTSSTNCTTLKPVSSFPAFNSQIERQFIVNDTWNMNIGSNGYVLNTPTGTLKKNYLYNIEYYLCASKALGNEVEIYATDYNTAYTTSNIYNSVSRSNLSPEPFLDTTVDMNSCYLYSGLVVPEQDYLWSGLRVRSSGTTISNVTLLTIAVNIRELGIYSTAVEDIIQNSGFATSESVEEVQDSVNQVQQEIQQTQDTITDSTSPDVSDMTNLAGYLPPGPLDSVLNLPLSILNSLNSKLSSSCTPLSLTLPFVNLPLNIPCLSTIFNQIAGLNVLWESIGVILGALIMYKYLTYLYNWVDDVTSLKHTRARLFGAKSDADNWGGVE